MGLRDEIMADLAEAFNDDLADAVTTFKGVGAAEGNYNPTTGKFEGEKITYSGRGVFSNYKLDDIDGSLVQSTDKQLLVLQIDITSEPKVDDVINNLRVISVTSDPVNVSYTLQLRG